MKAVDNSSSLPMAVVTPTHHGRRLNDAWRSLQTQDHPNWHWFVTVNDVAGDQAKCEMLTAMVKNLVGDDPRVTIEQDLDAGDSVGKRKHHAFARAALSDFRPEVLVELDHDDILVPSALSQIASEFAADPALGFVYSDWADFVSKASLAEMTDLFGSVPAAAILATMPDHDPQDPQGLPVYRQEPMRSDWLSNGFRFYEADIAGIRPGKYEAVQAFEASAMALSLIYWAPNHVRAWRTSVYKALGGYDPAWRLCDDHDLLCRTYLQTKMKRIKQPLYLYRVEKDGTNTWQNNQESIARLTLDVRARYFERMVLRQCDLASLPTIEMVPKGTGAVNKTVEKGWTLEPLTTTYPAQVPRTLPFRDNSVGAFRAYDFLCHAADKAHIMKEIWRCLVPGGYLLSMTPSTDGRGAWMDPNHVSYWNVPSFWYWTRKAQAAYIHNNAVRFQEVILSEGYPTTWHKENLISYTTAHLVALKEGYDGPGIKLI